MTLSMLHERNTGDDQRLGVKCPLTVGTVLDRLPLRIAALARLERVFVNLAAFGATWLQRRVEWQSRLSQG